MSENINYQKRQEEVLAWLKAKGKPEPKTWNYHQADDGRYYCYESVGRKRYGDVKNCEWCDKSYLSCQNNKFCSLLCGRALSKNNKEITCALCGIRVMRSLSALKKSVHGIYFCSRNCKYKAQAIRTNLYFRKTLYSRYDILKVYFDRAYLSKQKIYKCIVCNVKNKNLLDVHHIDKDRSNNLYSNFEILCKNHHATRHLSDDFRTRNYNFFTSRDLLCKINIHQNIDNKESKKPISINKKIFEDLTLKDFPSKKEIQKNNKGVFFIHKSTGKKRYGELTKCTHCNDNYVKTKTDNSVYCSQYCKRSFIQKELYKEYQCVHCNNMFLRNMKKVRSVLVFCSAKCQSEASKKGGVLVKSHYNDESNYREKAFKYLAYKCADCDVCFEPILDVHHKDGNRDNNDIDNLEILCPNHHATRHMRQDDKGEWVYSTKSLTPRDQLDEVKKALGI